MGNEDLLAEIFVGVLPAAILALLVMTARWILHVRDTVQEVNEAVNHRPANEPKLYDLIEQRFTQLDDKVNDAKVQMGTLLGAFSEHRDDDQANFDRIAHRLDRMEHQGKS